MIETVKKAISAVLTAVMIIGFTACGGTVETASPETPSGQTAANAETAEETEFRYKADYLPDAGYGGYEFRIVAYDEYPADQQEESGNLINDAIYQRNRLVEEQYDIKISETRYPYANYGGD